MNATLVVNLLTVFTQTDWASPSMRLHLAAGTDSGKDTSYSRSTAPNPRETLVRLEVRRAIIKIAGKGSAGPERMPAREIEDVVAAQLTSLLQSPQKLLDLLGAAQADRQSLPRMDESLN